MKLFSDVSHLANRSFHFGRQIDAASQVECSHCSGEGFKKVHVAFCCLIVAAVTAVSTISEDFSIISVRVFGLVAKSTVAEACLAAWASHSAASLSIDLLIVWKSLSDQLSIAIATLRVLYPKTKAMSGRSQKRTSVPALKSP